MKLFESILDDVEAGSSKAVEKVRDMSVQNVRYDIQVELKLTKTAADVQEHADSINSIAGRIHDLLESSPNIKGFSEIEYLSTWPELSPRALGAKRVLYSRPTVSGEYGASLRFSFSYSFRRPL